MTQDQENMPAGKHHSTMFDSSTLKNKLLVPQQLKDFQHHLAENS
jgi:hypothetical protein